MTRSAIERVAKERFGFARLRPGQAEAVEAVVGGRDTLVVMPTGAGKSAVYQLAGLLIDGVTVVVSPLVALQRDQVESIEQDEIAEAAHLNSSLRMSERREALADLEAGELEFLFLAPEQFASEDTLERVRRARPSLFVVDEAHCITEWGHDFRPEYLRLGAVVAELGRPPVLALTATASPLVRDEIADRLGLRDPLVIARGFDRPNIWLGVEGFHDADAKTEALLERVVESEKPGIVYTATRRRCEELAASLRERGVETVAYHAGLPDRERAEAQEAFMEDRVHAVVATVAFGLGIDKPNVRFVFHHEPSDSVDSYYQEIGRAGRDGEPARSILFYHPPDLGVRRFFAGSGRVDAEQIERVAAVVDSEDGLRAEDVAARARLSVAKTETALSRLEEVDAVEFDASGAADAADSVGSDEAADEAARAQERHREFERTRVEMMRAYAETRDCRRRYVLNYFGEEFPELCGFCDNCAAGRSSEQDTEKLPFPLGSRVRHEKWGEGAVQRYEADTIVVLFDEVGYRTLALPLVLETGVLAPAAS
ncbi:MAG: ATP-dependent DNA helicase [Actinomycetota bacterium]|nr:ATP-dependent DNA helicase [Actinomycetota bacterium]